MEAEMEAQMETQKETMICSDGTGASQAGWPW